MYILTYGIIPKKNVCHHCDTPLCIRPRHLFPGTDQDNMQDATRKGRVFKAFGERNGRRTKPWATARGEQVGASKLTWKKVRQIRKLYKYRSKTMHSYRLAKRFHVSAVTIHKIVTNQMWKEN